ncbi:hypothetical protein [uncultured Thiocystis sp.]|uniref:DUF7007 domain-containing protein n=1 Tax=uncultured Thiocystis sp. TaxID=1202134 RepID=UPI0025E8D6DF|nr:hypothetical protein [uncultured Thiocystis sp.]
MASTPTPWGDSQREKRFANGIVFFSTAVHGGFYVDPARRADMPEAIQNAITWVRLPGWYEEDQDWALVALAFPEHFDARACFSALAAARCAANVWQLDLARYLESTQGRACAAKAGQCDANGAEVDFGA